jgi:hypothetical protein
MIRNQRVFCRRRGYRPMNRRTPSKASLPLRSNKMRKCRRDPIYRVRQCIDRHPLPLATRLLLLDPRFVCIHANEALFLTKQRHGDESLDAINRVPTVFRVLHALKRVGERVFVEVCDDQKPTRFLQATGIQADESADAFKGVPTCSTRSSRSIIVGERTRPYTRFYCLVHVTTSVKVVPFCTLTAFTVLLPTCKATLDHKKIWFVLVFVPNETPLTVRVTEFVLAYTLIFAVGKVRVTKRRSVI